jgi:hypothetical protein
MKTIYFPEGVPLRLLKRLVILGPALIGLGVFLLSVDSKRFESIIRDPQGQLVLGVVLITLGVLMGVIGTAGSLLRVSWRLLSMTVEHEGSEIGVETPVKPGTHLAIRLELKALKDLKVSEARCRLLAEEKATPGSSHTRRIYENVVEDSAVKERALRGQKKLSCRFEQRVPVDVEVSSDWCFWSIEVEVAAKGAPRFWHKHPLTVA